MDSSRYWNKLKSQSLQQNILRECPEATSYAQKNVKTNSPASAWRLIIDRFILKHIQSCTITKAHRKSKCKYFTLTVEDLEPFISIMYPGNSFQKFTLTKSKNTQTKHIELCLSAISF